MSGPTRKDKATLAARRRGIPTKGRTAEQLEQECVTADKAFAAKRKRVQPQMNVELHLTVDVPPGVQTLEQAYEWAVMEYGLKVGAVGDLVHRWYN